MRCMSSRTPRKSSDPALPAAEFYRGETYDIDQSLGHLVRLLINSLGRGIDERMQEHDLTAMQWKPLLMIKLGRGDTAAELARQNGSDTGAMTRMLDRLEAKGLIGRKRSAVDRRVVHLELTEEGERVSNFIPYGLSDVMNAHLAGFSHDEIRQLLSLLKRVIGNGTGAIHTDDSNPGPSP
jgi:DNA-binding MarR family transcriptional regulator